MKDEARNEQREKYLEPKKRATVIWGRVESEMIVCSQFGWWCEQWAFKLGWRQGAGMVGHRDSWSSMRPKWREVRKIIFQSPQLNLVLRLVLFTL